MFRLSQVNGHFLGQGLPPPILILFFLGSNIVNGNLCDLDMEAIGLKPSGGMP